MQNMQADMALEQGIGELLDFFARHRKVLLLTGAGISTASGIPDYRDSNGARRAAKPVQGEDFRLCEAARKRYWARSMVGWPVLARAEPNAAHCAIAALQANRSLGDIITQNVDGLHQRAGSSELTELHGNIHRVVCLACARQFSRAVVQTWLEYDNPDLMHVRAPAAPDGDAQIDASHDERELLLDFRIPCCMHCHGMLKPDVVFFGDGVALAQSTAAQEKLAEADALLIVGSSVMVLSSFRLCRAAFETGKALAAINLGATRADHLLSFKTRGQAEHVLPLLARLLGAM